MAVSYPRPDPLTVRGIHWCASTNPDNSNLGWWLDECVAMGMGWIKVLDYTGSSVGLCQAILQKKMIPIVRLYRGRPNPGRLTPDQVNGLKALVAAGVRYFEPNNEPNLPVEWKEGQWQAGGQPAVVMDDWLADAAVIEDAGGLPGFPALAQCALHGDSSSIRWTAQAFEYLATKKTEATKVLSNGAWIAVHAATLNHFYQDTTGAWHLEYPADPKNQADKPGTDILQDDCGLLGYTLPLYYLRHHFPKVGDLPVISTEGGIFVPRGGSYQWDTRYPALTYDSQAQGTVAMFDWLAGQPSFYAMCPWLIANERLGHFDHAWTEDAWYPEGKNPLPVVTAMKQSAAAQKRPSAIVPPVPPIAAPQAAVVRDEVRNAAWSRGVHCAYSDTFALQHYAREKALGAPLTEEFDHIVAGTVYRVQGYANGIVYCEVGKWNKVTHTAW